MTNAQFLITPTEYPLVLDLPEWAIGLGYQDTLPTFRDDQKRIQLDKLSSPNRSRCEATLRRRINANVTERNAKRQPHQLALHDPRCTPQASSTLPIKLSITDYSGGGRRPDCPDGHGSPFNGVVWVRLAGNW